MKRISLYQYCLVIFLQKVHGASVKLHFPKELQKILYNIRIKYVNYLLSPYFKISLNKLNQGLNFKGITNSNIIWIFWWQGINKMPNIIKMCINSVKFNARDKKVILITKYNIRKYITLPRILYKKIKDKTLNLAHFSDIVRFHLLDKYGGLWIDSTIYCTNTITDNYFNYLYTTGGYQGTPPRFVKGRWAEFLIGGSKGNAALQFEDNFLQLYYCNNNRVLNYFLADYGLDYAYNHNLGNYRYYVDNIAKGANPHLFILANLLNKPYNSKKFKKITSDTNMFKLTYKKKFVSGNTFYQKLINK